VIVIVSIIGTLIPQQLPETEYIHKYGAFSKIIIFLNLNNLYHSFLFIFLITFFSLNIVVCTINRLIPSFKILSSSRIILNEEEKKNFPLKYEFKLKGDFKEKISKIIDVLKKHNYKLKSVEKGENIYFYAQKGILGRFGADIVHLSILLILIGGIIGGIKGYKEHVTILEGGTIKVPHENFYLRVDDFTTEYYPTGHVKDWKSTLTIIENGEEKITKTIEVNHPLTYKGVRFYQSSYGWDWRRALLTINVKERDSQNLVTRVKVRVGEKFSIPNKGLDIYAEAFVPDFVIGEGGQIFSRSNQPNNPAVLLEGRENNKIKFHIWIFAKFPDTHFSSQMDYKFELIDFEAPEYTGIQITKDPGVIFVWIGCTLVMLGLLSSFYIFHRRIWVSLKKSRDFTLVWIGGTSKKGRNQFEKEFKRIVDKLKQGE
jgi:cytochrome c biogenesis protein